MEENDLVLSPQITGVSRLPATAGMGENSYRHIEPFIFVHASMSFGSYPPYRWRHLLVVEPKEHFGL